MSPSTAENAGRDAAEPPLSARGRAILQAVADGRVELRRSCEPDLYIDGRCCADQHTAHHLSRRGLLRPQDTGRIGQRARAELTDSGRAALPRT